MAEPRRPPGGGGAGSEGLGRSRGGFTSKVHLSADGRCRPLSLVITPGQRADCTQFKPVLEKIWVPKLGPGRPRKKPNSLAADKAYSNRPCREYLRRPDPGEGRQPGGPSAQGFTRRAATGLRRRAVQEAKHRRTGYQSFEAVPSCRHSLRQARLRLPWHRDSGGRGDLAPDLKIREPAQRPPSAGLWCPHGTRPPFLSKTSASLPEFTHTVMP
ncbi:transposase [Streptomyces sp. cf386]|uniref:transposase n=1 Tax=Streptomyces sp. cf386 TaxID=1761904 RepID=UPI003526A4C3